MKQEKVLKQNYSDFDFRYVDHGAVIMRGSLNVERMYMMRFGCIPNILSVDLVNKEVDIAFVRERDFKPVFPDIDFFHSCISMNYADGDSLVFKDKPRDEYFDDNHSAVVIATPDIMAEISPDRVVLYHKESFIGAVSTVKNLIGVLPVLASTEPSRVRLVTFDPDRGFDTVESSLDSVKVDLSKHYNDDFAPVYEDIRRFMAGRGSGLIILHGQKGTGKTNFIRYLCQEHPARYIIISSSIAAKLGSPEFINFLMRNKDAVFILEDCEQVLMDREENTFGEAISVILNMSDGLLSDVFNAKFICTFNADISRIDPALLRKGRCFAKYEFKELAADKTAALLEELGHEVENPGPMTLTDIYNYEDTAYDKPAPRRPIGFRTSGTR